MMNTLEENHCCRAGFLVKPQSTCSIRAVTSAAATAPRVPALSPVIASATAGLEAGAGRRRILALAVVVFDLVLDFVALLQVGRAIFPIALPVHEDVLAAIVWRDEPEALVLEELLHDSARHGDAAGCGRRRQINPKLPETLMP